VRSAFEDVSHRKSQSIVTSKIIKIKTQNAFKQLNYGEIKIRIEGEGKKMYYL
jgi:hypothetical protein